MLLVAGGVSLTPANFAPAGYMGTSNHSVWTAIYALRGSHGVAVMQCEKMLAALRYLGQDLCVEGRMPGCSTALEYLNGLEGFEGLATYLCDISDPCDSYLARMHLNSAERLWVWAKAEFDIHTNALFLSPLGLGALAC